MKKPAATTRNLLIGCIALSITGVALSMSAIVGNRVVDWGSFPDWLGGIGTTTATVLFALGWQREAWLRRRDHERQAVMAIRQLLLDIEHLYVVERDENHSLTADGRNTESRLLREIQAHTAAAPTPLRERLYQLTRFYSRSAINNFEGDRDWLIAHNCNRYGLALVAAYVQGNPPPAPPSFVAAYEAALADEEAILEDIDREKREERERRRKSSGAEAAQVPGEENPQSDPS
ncbi:hypothetical protein [Micromonospora parathelypteridis]|uniref:Uncharacterized protein n=1 Tax=Micromonospora parathelypteridis TaxID=1839617 RepID=A0A840W015_9ACTN|nr:hypothetical protein [Micromonospora parathelypteridis]MBB5477659.1 hypothetical protein [Micromonospora parathelypteridis]